MARLRLLVTRQQHQLHERPTKARAYYNLIIVTGLIPALIPIADRILFLSMKLISCRIPAALLHKEYTYKQ